jgi:archaellum component FlaC
MSLGNTSKLIEESRKIVEASNDNSVLSLIFEIVTKIDNRMIQMEKNMGKRLDDMKADFLAVSARVRDCFSYYDTASLTPYFLDRECLL